MSLAPPSPVGHLWPRWAAAADLTGDGGTAVRQKLEQRLTLPPYAQQIALLLCRDSAGARFTHVLSWPFAPHLLERPLEWWRSGDAEPAQPGWPRKEGLYAITDVAAEFPLFAVLPDVAAVAFEGDEHAWHRARRSALSAAGPRQDNGPDGEWIVRVPETVTPWLSVEWGVPYPARNAPPSRSLVSARVGKPAGGILRSRQTVTIELNGMQSDVVALVHALVGMARDRKHHTADEANDVCAVLSRLAHADALLVESDIIGAHRRVFHWLVRTRPLPHVQLPGATGPVDQTWRKNEHPSAP